jgi:8-oxo-dGTP pyrophosphatase MutT (NUDIX family)
MSKKRIPRAGFIPYIIDNDTVKILFMKPSNANYGGPDFQVAKGKIEKGEDAETAAIREASEELGLKPKNVKKVKYLGKFLGYTEVFYGEIIDKDNFTEFTYETEETKWMTVEEFLESGRKIHRPIVKAFLKAIN